MANKQLSFSDVTIKKINIISQSFQGGRPYDLIPHLREINIYENIFSNSLKANITLDEAMNLPQTLPIVGEEFVEIDITIPGMSEKYNDDTSFPIKSFNHIGMIYAFNSLRVDSIIIGPSSITQLMDSLLFFNKLKTYDTKNIYDKIRDSII